MKAKPLPSQEELQRRFRYDPDTGKLYHKLSVGRVQAGTEAGSVSGNQYKQVCIHGKVYYVARVIWKLVHGEEPNQIDHINRDRGDNRLSNLRNVDGFVNQGNTPRTDKSSSKVPGVSFRPYFQKWEVKHGSKYIGMFETEEEAIAARKAAEVTALAS